MDRFRFASEQHLRYIQAQIDSIGHCQVHSDFVPLEVSDVLASGTRVLSESPPVSLDCAEVDYAMCVQGDLRLGERLCRLGRDAVKRIEEMVLSGSSGSLVRHGGVSRVSAPYRWSDRAPGEVLAEVRRVVSGGETDPPLLADTLLTSQERYQFLARTTGPVGGRPLLELLREGNEWTSSTGKPLRIFGRPELVSDEKHGSQRLVAYRCELDVLRVQMRPLRFASPQPVGSRYLVPVCLDVGGLEIRRPELVRYLDDI